MAEKKPLCKKEENKIEIVELSEHASVRRVSGRSLLSAFPIGFGLLSLRI